MSGTNAIPAAGPIRSEPRHRFLRTLLRHRSGVIGLILVVVALVSALGAPLFAPHDPTDGVLANRLVPPAFLGGQWAYPLGTDQLGRDTLSRLLFGGRVSLAAGAIAVVISLSIGVTLGIVAGFYGRWIDRFISFVVDVVISFPFILLALTLVSLLGPGLQNTSLALGISAWPIYARVIRNQMLSLREREYVLSARALGYRDLRLMTRHLLPNLIAPILVLGSLEVAQMILAESFLSFLGLGVQPPASSWGRMLGDGRDYLLQEWWLTAIPGLAIFATALGINLLGDGLRDALDPHQRPI